jgi:hypothetical protein
MNTFKTIIELIPKIELKKIEAAYENKKPEEIALIAWSSLNYIKIRHHDLYLEVLKE